MTHFEVQTTLLDFAEVGEKLGGDFALAAEQIVDTIEQGSRAERCFCGLSAPPCAAISRAIGARVVGGLNAHQRVNVTSQPAIENAGVDLLLLVRTEPVNREVDTQYEFRTAVSRAAPVAPPASS